MGWITRFAAVVALVALTSVNPPGLLNLGTAAPLDNSPVVMDCGIGIGSHAELANGDMSGADHGHGGPHRCIAARSHANGVFGIT
jgi:hypothetical protein